MPYVKSLAALFLLVDATLLVLRQVFKDQNHPLHVSRPHIHRLSSPSSLIDSPRPLQVWTGVWTVCFYSATVALGVWVILCCMGALGAWGMCRGVRRHRRHHKSLPATLRRPTAEGKSESEL